MLLADFIKLKKGELVLEAGCGCGVIGLILKLENPSISLDMLDLQSSNVNLSLKNLKVNGLKARVFECDFLNFKQSLKYDVIYSNPPFFKDGKSTNLHKDISKFESHLPLKKLLFKANSLLKPAGRVYLCYAGTRVFELLNAFKEAKLTPTKLSFIHKDLISSARLLLVEGRKSSKSACEVLPPIFTPPSRFKLKSFDDEA